MATGRGLRFTVSVPQSRACPTTAMPALATSSTAGRMERRAGAAPTCSWVVEVVLQAAART